MNRILPAVGLLLMAFTALPMSAAPAQAVVYCTTTGVPKGALCVTGGPARPSLLGFRPSALPKRGAVNRVGRR